MQVEAGGCLRLSFSPPAGLWFVAGATEGWGWGNLIGEAGEAVSPRREPRLILLSSRCPAETPLPGGAGGSQSLKASKNQGGSRVRTVSSDNPAAPGLPAEVGGQTAVSLRHSDRLPLSDCQKVKSGPGGSLPRLLTP